MLYYGHALDAGAPRRRAIPKDTMDNLAPELLGQSTPEHQPQPVQHQQRFERPREERAVDAYGDPLNLPSFEQVAKSISRAMRMNDFWPVQAERDRQLEAGRQMAAAEGFGKKNKIIDERESQIRAGQSASAKEFHSERQHAPQNNGNEFPQPPTGDGFAKKRRNRNRNKNRPPSTGPKPFVPH